MSLLLLMGSAFLAGVRQDAATLYESGSAKLDRGDYKGAIEDLTRSLELNPSSGVAFDQRGRARFELRDWEGAINDYKEAIRLGRAGAA